MILACGLWLGACEARPGAGPNDTAGSDGESWSDAGVAGDGDGDGDGDGESASQRPGSADASAGAQDAGLWIDIDAGAPVVVELFPTNPFVLAAHDPFSTFGADVDSASYDIFRGYAEGGSKPPAERVRVEEFVNSFAYAYPAPAPDAPHPFSIALEAAPSLADQGTVTLRVGIQGKQPLPFEKKPANLVFLVDVSGSMADQLPFVQRMLSVALQVLAPGDLISIVTYAGSTAVRLTPTPVSDADAIRAEIDGLTSGGSTFGSGGIQLAYEQAEAGFIEGGINHVLLCTDGDFNVGVTSDDALVQLITEKRKSGVTLTAVGFGATVNDQMMERVSNAGNGIYSVVFSEAGAEEYAETRLLGTLMHIAKDVKLQVEVNPEHVLAYRLIGYEDRAIADESFRDDLIDAGEIGAGHRVTALYELVLAGGSVPMPADAPEIEGGTPVDGLREVATNELVRVKVRYKTPGASESDPAFEVATGLEPGDVLPSLADASDDTRFAMAIAAYAEQLKQSPYVSSELDGAIDDIFAAQASRDAQRKELKALVDSLR